MSLGPRVLVVSPEPVGESMAGPAIRAYELARALAPHCTVTLAAPGPSALAAGDSLTLIEAGVADYEALAAAAERHDVIVVQRLPGQLLRHVARARTRIVFDLYNPLVVEVLEAAGDEPIAAARRAQRIATLGVLAGLAAADYVICASERQRDLWLGGMAFRGLLDPARYRRDPSFRSFVDVVPFGVPDEPPPARPASSPWPGIGPRDRVLVWGGGVWRWLDALTPIRAIEILRHTRDDVQLVFIGTGRPVTAEGSSAADQAVAEAERLGLLDVAVHINPGWTPYRERGALLAAADVGVSAHHDHLESRFAFRTRLLDYLWAGLPVVSTRGDALGDLILRRGLGAAPPPNDPQAFATACARLLDDDALREQTAEAVRRAAAELRWSHVARPLIDWCLDPPPPVRRGAAALATTAGQQALIAVDLLERFGPREVARRAGWAVGRSTRRIARRP
ncbi:MAG TPA: glycosyltransferase, partial [Thermoleophilaceae bacterium]